MQAEAADAIDTAIAWQVRLAEADEGLWAEFIAWLEASTVHAEAYDRVAAADRIIADVRFPEAAPIADNDNLPSPRRWAFIAGGFAAAAAIALTVAPGLFQRRAESYQVATREGEQRAITLGDGTRIELSGGTQLTLDRGDPRVAALDRGEALFHVHHDSARPFTLQVGGVAVRDVGTVFNVSRSGTGMSVAVSEGAVLFQPEGAAVTLRSGEALTAQTDGQAMVRARIAPVLVGGWRSGRLSFDGQPLRQVAATLKRLYGTDIALEGDLSERPLTGVVHFSGTADQDVPRLAELIGATWRRDSRRWILSEGRPVTP